jgi:hypothetical protein
MTKPIELTGWKSLIHEPEAEETTPHLIDEAAFGTANRKESQFTRRDLSARHVTDVNPPVTRGVYRPKSQ